MSSAIINIGNALYIIILLFGLFGNVTFILAVKSNEKLHTPVFILLANECFSDLLYLLGSTVFLGDSFIGSWVFGDALCRILGFTGNVSLDVSILSLSVVSVERYFSICRLNYQKKSLRWCIKVSAVIWLVAVVACAPVLYGHGVTLHGEHSTKNKTNLSETMKNATHNMSETNTTNISKTMNMMRCDCFQWPHIAGIIYYSVHGTIFYLCPLATLLVAHVKLLKMLIKKMDSCTSVFKCSNTVGISHHCTVKLDCLQKNKMSKSKLRDQKITEIIMSITVLFLLLWSPYAIGQVVRRLDGHQVSASAILIWSAILLAMELSTTVNFVVSLRMSKEFRSTVISLLRLRKRRQRKVHDCGSSDKLSCISRSTSAIRKTKTFSLDQ